MTITRPPKLLKGNLISATPVSFYTDPTNPYHGKASSWAVSLYCAQVSTGYRASVGGALVPYTVADISVGDWIAGGTNKGIANRITSITAVNVPATGRIGLIVDDPGCYNATLDSTGNGNGLTYSGNTYVFEVGVNGIPVIAPEFSGVFLPEFGTYMLSRFLGRVQISSGSGSSGGGGGSSGVTIQSSGSTLGVATAINFVGSNISATLNAGIATVSFAGSVSDGSNSGSLSFGPLHVSYTTELVAMGATLDFTLATGAYFYLNNLTVSDNCVIQCYSTSDRTDTNPYQFRADKAWPNLNGSLVPWLTDDGSFGANGLIFPGPPSIFLQVSENPSAGMSYWRLTNTATIDRSYTVVLDILQL
jgi:hypothetical protein